MKFVLILFSVSSFTSAYNLISLLGNSYIYRTHHYPTTPDAPYALRDQYANGVFGVYAKPQGTPKRFATQEVKTLYKFT